MKKQINQLQSNLDTLTANLQNLENEIKVKKKNTENVSRDKKRFKSATGLNPYGFLAILNF